MLSSYQYHDILAASEKVNWKLEDVIGAGQSLDFSRSFLPESLARSRAVAFLDKREQLKLNQIRGNGYLYTFGMVEEFILPFVLDHARPQLNGDDHRVRAMLSFANEEAKHIHLFRSFRNAFERGFGVECGVIGPPEAIGRAVLAHEPLAVALVILHIEWMTQRHYIESVEDNSELDPMFKSLLRHHWMEEAQHAKLDALMVEALSEGMSPADRARAVDGYLAIGGLLDAGLKQQAGLDALSLERAIGRSLTATEREDLQSTQHQALRWTFLGSGMTHPRFLESLARLGPELRARIESVAPVFC